MSILIATPPRLSQEPKVVRLLLLTEYFAPHPGGTAVYYFELLRRLPDTEVIVVARTCRGAPAFDSRQPFRIIRTPFPPIPKVRMAVEFLAMLLVGTWIVLRHRIDLLHSGQVFPIGLAAYCIHLLTGVPCATYLHGEEITMYGRRRWRRAVLRYVLRRMAGIFVNSLFTARTLSPLEVPQQRVHLVRPGVNTERFRITDGSATRKRLQAEGQNVILTVGRLIPRKGQDTVIRLLPRIAREVPDVRYWIAGDGQTEEQRRLQALARKCGVEDRVKFLGVVPEEELPSVYAACDVFVMLNRMTETGDVEGFGMVFIEANAQGKPVVAGRSGGAPEAVQDGQTGFLINEGDDDVAVQTIVRLLRDDGLRHRLGEEGRRWATRSFSWERAAQEVARVNATIAMRSKAAFTQESPPGNEEVATPRR